MAAKDRPNILLFFTDQHRLSALGCYGETPCKTPNIDRLAEMGVRFETAYTCCPVCSPTRASVMTGLHTHAHGVLSNTYNLGTAVSELPDSPRLLPRRLGEAGYACGYTGKWHLGSGRDEWYGQPHDLSLPTTRGFHGIDFPGHGNGGHGYPEYKRYLSENGWAHEVHCEPKPRVMSYGITQGPTESTVPYFLAEQTIGLIDRFAGEEKPFFLWHNNWGPHAPYYVPPAYYDMYRDVEIPPWPDYAWDSLSINRPHRVKVHPDQGNLTWDDWAEAIRHYYAFTTLIDEQFGRIVEHLEKTGQAAKTVILFTSDHGESLGTHGGMTDKGWQHWEATQRVGFIVADPHGDKGGTRSEWASALDVYPTILEYAGAEFDPEEVHGRSVVPLVRGESVPWRDTAVVEFNGVNSIATTMVTLRHGDIKYGWNCSNLDELYDLKADPHELRNVVDEPGYAETLTRMRLRLLHFLRTTGHQGATMFSNSRLRSMGIPKQEQGIAGAY